MEPQKSAYPHSGAGQEYPSNTGNYPPPTYDQTQYGAPPYPQAGGPQYGASMPHPHITQPQIVHTIVNQPPVGPDPSTIVCPSCRQQVITRLDYETTTKTHIMAALLCAFVCWPCAWIPYVMDSCKNANHYCPSCGAFIGTYKS